MSSDCLFCDNKATVMHLSCKHMIVCSACATRRRGQRRKRVYLCPVCNRQNNFSCIFYREELKQIGNGLHAFLNEDEYVTSYR